MRLHTNTAKQSRYLSQGLGDSGYYEAANRTSASIVSMALNTHQQIECNYLDKTAHDLIQKSVMVLQYQHYDFPILVNLLMPVLWPDTFFSPEVFSQFSFF